MLSRVHKTKKAKKEAFEAHFMQAKQEESKETIEQRACEISKRAHEPPMGLQLHLVGYTHARTSFLFKPSSSLGRFRHRYPRGGRPELYSTTISPVHS